MQYISQNNKRIAKNTLLLYIRMFISMAVSLYTSRVILHTLGIDDYGIYNVVGGVVAMFSFINSTMSGATSRFLTYALGKENICELRDTFSSSFWVHTIIALIVFLLSETIGLWFLTSKMVIAENRMFAAHVVFQLSVLSTLISITQVPYNASIIAHEKMNVYAYVELVNVFLKLGTLYLLVILPLDKLIIYAILVLMVGAGIAMYYRYYCICHFKECHVLRKYSPEIVKPMLSFSGWDLYGNLSVTARTQGVAMLINIFFGPAMNAAAGIATNVQGAVGAFANNINTAVRPQIIKYYAQNHYEEMSGLINNSCKMNYLLMMMIIVPILGEIDYILKLWLGVVPEQTSYFCLFTMLFCLFSNVSYLIVAGIHATGKIKRPSLINGTLYLLVMPISYFAFSLGGNAWISYAFNFCAVILGMLSNAWTLHMYCPVYKVNTFVCDVLLRCLLISVLPVLIIYLLHVNIEEGFFRLVLTVLSTLICLGVTGWYALLSKDMRVSITIKIVKKFHS
ncbi:MATE family efflux transporter [Bacteroides sp. f07]|uniref:polysaccharide biosynthesis protein n=1 Tax=Bacteroides sp. f07 TaxID=3132704 RepID=UPI0034B8FBDA